MLAHWIDVALEPSGHNYCVHPDYLGEIAFRSKDIRSKLPTCYFDLVLCHNIVFTYFDIELQCAILDRLATVLC